MSRSIPPRTAAARLAGAALLLLPAVLPFASCSPPERDFGGGQGGGTSTTTSTSMTCEPGSTASCYSGPDGTEGVGVCAPGLQVCNPEGTGYGPCEGEVLPGTEDCAAPLDEDCDGAAQACPLTTLWARGFPGGFFFIFPRVATDAQGNVLFAGAFAEQLDLGNGEVLTAGSNDGLDAFLVKLSPEGDVLWSRQFGGLGTQYIRGVGTDATGGVLVAGGFSEQLDFGNGPVTSNQGSEDVFVARFSPDGMPDWRRIFGGPGNDNVFQLAVNPAGQAVVTGNFSDTVNFGTGSLTATSGSNTFVCKLAAGGSPTVFARAFASVMGSETASGVAADSLGNTVLTGTFSQQIDFGTGLLSSVGSNDVFVTRLGSTGGALSAVRYGDALADQGFDVAVGPDDGVVVAGDFRGIVDFGGGPQACVGDANLFLASYGAGGEHRWSMRLGEGETSDHQMAVTVDAEGNTLVTGWFNTELRFGADTLQVTGMAGSDVDVFVAKLGPMGEPLVSRSVGTMGADGGFDIAADPTGAPVITGISTSGMPIDFGTGPLPVSGSLATYFVVKLAP